MIFNRPEKLNPIAKWAEFVKPEGENNNGELALIASGFANPTGVVFLGNRLFVSDINGDFYVGSGNFLMGSSWPSRFSKLTSIR